MHYDVNEIIIENKKRWERLNSPYDPLYGIGSPLKRVPILISEKVEWYVPESFMESDLGISIRLAGTFERAAALSLKKQSIPTLHAMQLGVVSCRCKHDFEFWAATSVKITDRKGNIVPFILNREQRKILTELEEMRLRGAPIQAVILKSRQIGTSTFIQMYIAWLQLFHVPGKNAFIIADKQNKARNILEMYVRMGRFHPRGVVPGLPTIEFKPYAQSQTNRQIVGREQFVGVSSSQSPDDTRNFTVQLFQCSEVAYWDDTPQRNPYSIIQGVMGTFPKNQPYTLYVEESTANGPGDYFHKSCRAAWEGRSNDRFIFIPFFENTSEYYVAVDEPAQFVESMNEYERFQWEHGATLEHILWWRGAARDLVAKGGELWRVKWEYPTTRDEPFEGSEIRVFRFEYVEKAWKQCREPVARGTLVADAQKGPDALRNIQFIPQDRGELLIWRFPKDLVLGRPNKRYTNRYGAFTDVGGRSPKADYSDIAVVDRAMLAFGGVPEICAEWNTHMDQDLFAWACARLCTWYENALLAVEINKTIDPDVLEPDSGYTILDEIRPHYSNLYYRIRPETDKQHWDGLIGFHTNTSTKKMIIDHLNGALRSGEYEERHREAVEQMRMYEFKDSGRKKMGAKEGYKDDMVITHAGVVWLSSQMDSVVEIDIPTTKPYKVKEAHPAQF